MPRQPQNNFTWLFLGLLALLVSVPLLEMWMGERAGTLVSLSFTLLVATGVWSLAESAGWFRFGLALAALEVFLGPAAALTEHPSLLAANLVVALVFSGLSIAIGMRHVFRSGDVTPNHVMGAVCVYLLLGVFWSLAYLAFYRFEPGAFRVGAVEEGFETARFMYFSFVTLTTLGYGDISPDHPLTRLLAYMQAVTGQLYLTVLVAALVGRHVAARGPRDG